MKLKLQNAKYRSTDVSILTLFPSGLIMMSSMSLECASMSYTFSIVGYYKIEKETIKRFDNNNNHNIDNKNEICKAPNQVEIKSQPHTKSKRSITTSALQTKEQKYNRTYKNDNPRFEENLEFQPIQLI